MRPFWSLGGPTPVKDAQGAKKVIDYGPGDMVTSLFPKNEGPGERILMVGSVRPFAREFLQCNAHSGGSLTGECPCLSVHFIDYPDPTFGCWTACAFRKIDHKGDEIEKMNAAPVIPEPEPA